MYYGNRRLWWKKHTKLEITDTELYVLVVSLSAQDNEKLLQQLKAGFKRTINRYKYQSGKKKLYECLKHLISPSFQRLNRLFALSFESDEHRTSYKQYFLPTVEIKDYNIMIDGIKFFDQPVNII